MIFWPTLMGTIWLLLLSVATPAEGDPYRNPKEIFGDPMIARMPPGKAQLTPSEKEEIQKYGYTALELMIYSYASKEPGRDNDRFDRVTVVDSLGNMRIREFLCKYSFYYKDIKALITQDGIKPGELHSNMIGLNVYPPENVGSGGTCYTYLNSAGIQKARWTWSWSNKLRRVRVKNPQIKDDNYTISDLTWDDLEEREPWWEEEHKILGTDILKGQKCFVVESRNIVNPKYYLTRRVTWVEEKDFRELHEEQFDRKGRLFRAIDKDWIQVKPWGYWAWSQWNSRTLDTRVRTIYQWYDWIFDQGFGKRWYSQGQLRKEFIWRKPKSPLPYFKGVAELPPEPQIRWEFWNTLGVKIATAADRG
ncbi:MAG: outer membrane lipoprotein-sorting protein [Candidatus Tectomicrobia bacterium]|uniref:Outer membrane lipoprotein-sorting protein n=1 Tax=Tectimicrobiota bacterium TaxID=2528274 RepID=A0A932CLU2_UNCTE|nr:outer membrane lipoprotein-sorting protein [Candidatus Tectomicrobia bacterium]